MAQSNGYLRYILNELLDEDQDGIPDQRQGIPRTPGMGLADPSSDERMDDYIGIDQPEMDMAPESEFEASPLDQFLERFSAGGVPGGLQRPQGFLQGLVSGAAQGAVGRGERVGERRKKFERAQTLRAAERDKANLQATRDLAKERGEATREAVRGTRAERAKKVEYERDNPKPTPEQLKAMPWLGRILDENGRVRRADLLSDDPALAGQKETRRQFESDRDYGLKDRSERRQAANDAKTASGKPPTEAQGRAGSFYTRASSAASQAAKDGLEDRLAKNQTALWGLKAPHAMQSADQQAYTQAIRDFGLAFLRKESGATILPSEFEYVFNTFFAAPGDKPGMLEQKRKSREEVLKGLQREGAPALAPEDAVPRTSTPAIPATWKRVQ